MVNANLFSKNILFFGTVADLSPFRRLKNEFSNVCTYVQIYVHMYIPCAFDLNTYVWQMQIRKKFFQCSLDQTYLCEQTF
jgi:hypothetical protein